MVIHIDDNRTKTRVEVNQVFGRQGGGATCISTSTTGGSEKYASNKYVSTASRVCYKAFVCMASAYTQHMLRSYLQAELLLDFLELLGEHVLALVLLIVGLHLRLDLRHQPCRHQLPLQQLERQSHALTCAQQRHPGELSAEKTFYISSFVTIHYIRDEKANAGAT